MAELKELLVTCRKNDGVGFGERPPPIPAPQPSPLQRPHLLRPAPTDALRSVEFHNRLPSPWSPSSFQMLEARDSQSGPQSTTYRLGSGQRPDPGQAPLDGTYWPWGCQGTRKARKGEAAKDWTRALEHPLHSCRASLNRTSFASRAQTPDMTDASVPCPILTRSSQLPGSELD